MAQSILSDTSERLGIRFPDLAAPVRWLKRWLSRNSRTAVDHAPAEISWLEAELRAQVGRGDISRPAALAALRQDLEAIGPDLDASTRLVAQRALDLTRATGAAIAQSQGDEMICVATAGSDAPGLGARVQSRSGLSGECVRTASLLRCDDSEIDERVDRETCRLLGVRSIVAAPIVTGDSVTGFLEVFSSCPNNFSTDDDSVLQELAKIISFALGPTARAPATKNDLATGFAAEKLSSHGPTDMLLVAAGVTVLLACFWVFSPWGHSIKAAFRPTATQRSLAPVSNASRTDSSLPVYINDFSALRKMTEQGDPAAQFALGAKYAVGEEVQQNYAEAVRWFSKAAEQGNITAQTVLGAYYTKGTGVPQDLSRAYFWSTLAQAGGDQASKYRVAVLTSRMTANQVLAAQKLANEWLRQHPTVADTPSR